MWCSVFFTRFISNNQVRKALQMEILQKYQTDFSWVHSRLIFPSAVMKCYLTEDQYMVFNRSDLCIRRHQITNNPDGPVKHFHFLVRVKGKSKQPASDPKPAQFLDLPPSSLLMGRESASSFSLWRLCHRNCRTGRPSLLFSQYSKHKQDYIHAIQMRRNAWRQVQTGNYTPCLQMCSSTQWNLIYGAPNSEGGVTQIYPNVTSEKRLLHSSYTFLNISSRHISDIWRCGSGVHRSRNRWKDKLDRAWVEWSEVLSQHPSV